MKFGMVQQGNTLAGITVEQKLCNMLDWRVLRDNRSSIPAAKGLPEI
jgi:hypothetical protein